MNCDRRLSKQTHNNTTSIYWKSATDPPDRTMVRRGTDLTSSQNQDLMELVDQNADVFSSNSRITHLVHHNIKTPRGMVVKQQAYRVLEVWQWAIKEEVERLLQDGIIKESASLWSNPYIIITKPDSTRLWVSQVSGLDSYRIDDLVERIRRAQFISNLADNKKKGMCCSGIGRLLSQIYP